jgi:hypothetical protein
MAASIEEIIHENLLLEYPMAYAMEIAKVTDTEFIATMGFWMDENIRLRVKLNDEEEIIDIEEIARSFEWKFN